MFTASLDSLEQAIPSLAQKPGGPLLAVPGHPWTMLASTALVLSLPSCCRACAHPHYAVCPSRDKLPLKRLYLPSTAPASSVTPAPPLGPPALLVAQKLCSAPAGPPLPVQRSLGAGPQANSRNACCEAATSSVLWKLPQVLCILSLLTAHPEGTKQASRCHLQWLEVKRSQRLLVRRERSSSEAGLN